LRDSRRPFLPAKVRVKSGGVPPSRPGDSALQYDDVVLGRRSIRGYKPDPVPKALIREVIEIAMRAPSSLNTQPWNFYVVAGAPLDRIRAGNTERNLAGVPSSREFAAMANMRARIASGRSRSQSSCSARWESKGTTKPGARTGCFAAFASSMRRSLWS
jgi:hypothetical protein